jgi:hypothetical protein
MPTTDGSGSSASAVSAQMFGDIALDILRESASQGSLQKSVLATQGLITEAGYKEQADSYRTMANVAGMAAQAENTASTGDEIAGGIKFAASIATLALL